MLFFWFCNKQKKTASSTPKSNPFNQQTKKKTIPIYSLTDSVSSCLFTVLVNYICTHPSEGFSFLISMLWLIASLTSASYSISDYFSVFQRASLFGSTSVVLICLFKSNLFIKQPDLLQATLPTKQAVFFEVTEEGVEKKKT